MPPFEMQHQEFEPPEELRDSIKCFWYNKRESDGQQSSFEVIPDGYAEIIFYFGNVSTLLHNGNLQVLPSPFMMGLLNEPVHFYTKNRLEELLELGVFLGRFLTCLGYRLAKRVCKHLSILLPSFNLF